MTWPKSRLIDPIADPEWLVFVESSPDAEVFHHPRWLALLRDQYGYRVEACCLANGNGIEAGIPVARIESRLTGKRLVSLPFSDVCSPALASGAGPDALDALGGALAGEARRAELGLTVHAPLPGAPEAIVQPRFVRHLLSLGPDAAEIEASYAKQIERGVKKAEREGLRLERRGDRAALDAFFTLHLQTRRKLGVPTQPKGFIRRFEELFDSGLGFVALVLDGSKPIAAAVFLTHNGTATYKYGASDASMLGKRPNNLLFAEVIRWACESGFQTLRLRPHRPGQRGAEVLQAIMGSSRGEPLLHLPRRGGAIAAARSARPGHEHDDPALAGGGRPSRRRGALQALRLAMEPRPDLSVVVVTHNGREMALRTLRSAQAASGAVRAEWLVVDAGSSDGTPEAIEREIPGARVFRRDNRGFAASNNVALGLARGRYVLLLNPDVEVRHGTLAELVAEMDARPELGLASVVQRGSDGELQPSIRRFPSPLRSLGEALFAAYWPVLRGFQELETRPARYSHEGEAEWLVGAFLIARREAAEAVGGLDDRFFLYSEEIDWCYRFWQTGWPVAHLPVMTITHHAGKRSRGDLMAQLSHSRLLFAAKHYGPARRSGYAPRWRWAT